MTSFLRKPVQQKILNLRPVPHIFKSCNENYSLQASCWNDLSFTTFYWDLYNMQWYTSSKRSGMITQMNNYRLQGLNYNYNLLLAYLRYRETKSWEKSINSLITAAGECMPRNGTMSTCNQFSTADPTTAPATRPPRVIKVAFPANMNSKTLKYYYLAET
jgi:hypothetical protein